jgi:hypothetical protein
MRKHKSLSSPTHSSSTVEEIVNESADDDARACELLVGSSLAKSTPTCMRGLCEIELPVMTFRTQKNLGRRFIGCSKYKVRI